MFEFAGYDMPVWYTSISDEHLAVRNGCGVLDVSHMGRFRVTGADSGKLLDRLLPTNILSQSDAKAIYTILLNERGGILDDLIVMKLSSDNYLAVVNAINTQADLKHIVENSQGLDVSVQDVTESSAMVAVQGPDSQRVLQPLISLDLNELKRFRCVETQVMGQHSLISRTGYTGEDGFEVVVYDTSEANPTGASAIWEKVVETAKPCGLGARDSLRIEAGYPLYGAEIDAETNPIEADLAWVVSAGKTGYLGQEAIAEARGSTPTRTRRGIVLDQGIPRNGFEVLNDGTSEPVGRVTSGTFSPVLHKGIAMALIATESAGLGERIRVRIRDSAVEGCVVRPPFYDEKVYGWKRLNNSK
jgi:aminomethyltransferase